MPLSCKTCGAPLDEEHIDRSRGLARCRYCDTVVELDPAFTKPTKRAWGERAPVPMPERFHVVVRGGTLSVRWRWLDGKAALMALITVGWLVMLGTGAMKNITNPTTGQPDLGNILPHIVITLGLLYVSAAYLLNTTTLMASSGALHVRHAPIPWLGNGTVRPVRQLFSKERVHHHKHGRRTYTYELHAIVGGGKHRKLVGGLSEAPQVLWLEQAIEEHLGISDRPVGGELPRY